MNFKTYTEARAALDAINGRLSAHKATAPKNDAAVEAHRAYAAGHAEIITAAADAGFKRIFDGSFKLSPEQVALPE